MEYRILSSLPIDFVKITPIILSWYQSQSRQDMRTVATFHSFSGQQLGQLSSQQFGISTTSPNIKSATNTNNASPNQHQSYSQSGSIQPISTQPAATQTETQFYISPSIRLQQTGRTGGLVQDLFFWQDNHVLVIERLSGHYFWKNLKAGWDGANVTQPQPVYATANNPGNAQILDVSKMSKTQKIEAALERVANKVAPHFKQQVLELKKPENIALMIAFVAVFAIAQATPIGWVADAVAIVGGIFIGVEVFAVAKLVYEFYETATNARNTDDLEEAAGYLAEAIAKVGIDVILGLLVKTGANKLKSRPGTQRPTVETKPGGGTVETKPSVIVEEPTVSPNKPRPRPEPTANTPPADPPGTYRDPQGRLRDSKTSKFVKDPNKAPTNPKKPTYQRSMAERKKALLRDAKDPNSDLSPEARAEILKTNGNKVPDGYEVSHEEPLYTRTTDAGKAELDVADNMKTQPEPTHRARHRVCGDQYHQYGPTNKPSNPQP
jgi:hypothetical protein